MGPVGSRAIRLIASSFLSLSILVLATACDARIQDVSMLRPASPQATGIRDLATILLIIAAIAFVIVEAWLLLAAFRFRNRREEEAVQTHGNRVLETGWTVATAVVIFAVLGLTVRTMMEVAAVPPSTAFPAGSAFPGDMLTMRVVGHQWWWTFEYPTERVVAANEIHVPVGKTVKVQLEADDVIHSFWAPRLNGKTDTIPGHTNFTAFVAVEPGVYHGLCGEYCGTQHARMGFRIIAEPVEVFSEWVKAQQADAAPPATDQQRAGQQAFGACAGCHTVRGTQAQGKSGPDLTHFASRQSIAADTLENTPENLAVWLRDPQGIKPGNKMPKPALDQATLDRIAAYLGNLK